MSGRAAVIILIEARDIFSFYFFSLSLSKTFFFCLKLTFLIKGHQLIKHIIMINLRGEVE